MTWSSYASHCATNGLEIPGEPSWNMHTWYSLWGEIVSQIQNGWSLREWVSKKWSGVINATFPISAGLLHFLVTAAPPQITVHKEIEKPLFSLTLGCKAEDLGCKVKDIKEWTFAFSCCFAITWDVVEIETQWQKHYPDTESIITRSTLSQYMNLYIDHLATASPMALWPLLVTAVDDLQFSWHVCLQAVSGDGAFNARLEEFWEYMTWVWCVYSLMDLRDTISFPLLMISL